MGDEASATEWPRRRSNPALVQMAHRLAEVGPNVNEIARLTGQHKETVRYRYHRFFLDKGITVQAVPSYTRLGFKRLIVFAKLAAASPCHQGRPRGAPLSTEPFTSQGCSRNWRSSSSTR